MFRYILKRILIFIPTLFVITLVGFIISVNAPGDPVERMVVAAQSGGEIGSQTVSQIEQKLHWKRKLGLDLPVFYLSLSKLSYPDTLYKVYDKNEKEALEHLLDDYGNWPEITKHFSRLGRFYQEIIAFKLDTAAMKQYDKNIVAENFNQIKFESLSLRSSYEDAMINAKYSKILQLFSNYEFFKPFKDELTSIKKDYDAIRSHSTKWKNYVPALYFYPKNQYHRWLFGDGEYTKGLIRGDFGLSYNSKKPITDVISERIGWSMFFSLFSIILAYCVSIPIGVKAAEKRGGRFDKTSSIILFAIYSLPSFFVAVSLLMIFGNPDMMNLFPASGVKPPEGYPDAAGFFTKLKLSLPYVILPLISYTYSSLAFISRTMRGAMIENIGQDYVRTARAKGLAEKDVIWKHAFRNSLLPIITMFASIFPAAIGGSVILETIFTIPGMGYESFLAISTNDYPMIISVLTISGVLTLIGYLFSDILYAVADPRISYN
ncbi:MAG: ABC transporter permease subunit [Bacteroidia bacterium]